MARLYAITSSLDEIAAQFEVPQPGDIDVPPELVEGFIGPIVIERDGRRMLKSASWGFPRQTVDMRRQGEPIGRIGLVADLRNPLWDRVAIDPRYRCLIPMSHFANPEGVPGKKTRVWFSAADGSILAWAGFVKRSEEFGVVYAGLTIDANDLVKPYNDRMPLLLGAEEYDRWLHGPITDVIQMQFRPPPPSEMLTIQHTRDRWRSAVPPHSLQSTSSMLM